MSILRSYTIYFMDGWLSMVRPLPANFSVSVLIRRMSAMRYLTERKLNVIFKVNTSHLDRFQV
jgi:hypothetical protein